MARGWAWLRVVFGVGEIKPTHTEGNDMEDTVKAWWKDAIERLGWTFLQGAMGILTAQQFGWIQLGDGDLWKAAAAGGAGASFSFIKSLASTRLGSGGTAQLGLKTYSYTEAGPGSAGEDIS